MVEGLCSSHCISAYLTAILLGLVPCSTLRSPADWKSCAGTSRWFLQVSAELAAEAADADLVVLEGMGRAIETNLLAKFTVDSLKYDSESC